MRSLASGRTELRLLLLLLLPLAPASARAQSSPWSMGVEFGHAVVHRSTGTGVLVGLRLNRSLPGIDHVRLATRAYASPADESFLVLDAGAELAPLPRARVRPLLGLGAGLLVEPEYVGPVLSGTAGVQAQLSRSVTFGVHLQRGRHGGERGPDLLFLALEYRGGS